MGKKTTARGLKKSAGGASSSTVPTTPAPVNWTKSTVTEATLQIYVDYGELPPKDEIQWRAAGEEIRPKPKENEIVVLLDHVTRGLRPPGSLFFRWVMSYYGLTPLDIAPNSVLNISNFVVFCEDYLQVPPSLALFLEIFYCNPQNRKNQALGPYGGFLSNVGKMPALTSWLFS